MNRLLAGVLGGALCLGGAQAQTPLAGTGTGVSLDELLERYRADAPPPPAGEVSLDAWVEERQGRQELVIVLAPEGETRLNADPGITVTPRPGAAVWQVPVPHRVVDPSTHYFEPPATIRLPFTGGAGEPIEVLVEYAYCVVDYQCFFGEETLSVVGAGY